MSRPNNVQIATLVLVVLTALLWAVPVVHNWWSSGPPEVSEAEPAREYHRVRWSYPGGTEVWMVDGPMNAGRGYWWFKAGDRHVMVPFEGTVVETVPAMEWLTTDFPVHSLSAENIDRLTPQQAYWRGMDDVLRAFEAGHTPVEPAATVDDLNIMPDVWITEDGFKIELEPGTIQLTPPESPAPSPPTPEADLTPLPKVPGPNAASMLRGGQWVRVPYW